MSNDGIRDRQPDPRADAAVRPVVDEQWMVLKLQFLGLSMIIHVIQELIMARIHDVDAVVAEAAAFNITAVTAALTRMAVAAAVDKVGIEEVDMTQSKNMKLGRRDDEIHLRHRVKKNVANDQTRPMTKDLAIFPNEP
jgi:hypothetical protein